MTLLGAEDAGGSESLLHIDAESRAIDRCADLRIFIRGFVKSLVRDFHSSRTKVTLAFTLANVLISVSSPLVGRLVDRFGARRVILQSTVSLGLLLISFTFISTSLWQLSVLFIALGFIGSGTAPVPYGKVVSNWFDRRRGLALGLMMAGIGIEAMAMPPIAQHLITILPDEEYYSRLG